MKMLLTLAVPLMLLVGCDRPNPVAPPDPAATNPLAPTSMDPITTTDGVHPVDQLPTEGDPTVIDQPPRPATQCEGQTGDELARCLREGRQELPQDSTTPDPRDDRPPEKLP